MSDPEDAGKYRVENQQSIQGQVVGDYATVHIYNTPIQPAPPEPVWSVPFARNPFFAGREELLMRLQTQFRTTKMAALGQPQAISGLGGIGKTQLAVEYAYQYRQNYQTVLWAHAETTEALTTSYTEMARLLQLSQKDVQEQEVIVQGVIDWLSTQKNWLLILDNADEPDVLIPFLPRRVGGHILVTTRASDLSNLGLGFGHTLAVKTFPDAQGALFLLHRADLLAAEATLEDASSQDREVALQIVHELGGLPLALDQAGAYLKATECGLITYQKLYQQHRVELLKKRHGHDHPKPVATTWDLSFQRVEATNPAAADLLRLCAFLAPDAIPEEILTQGMEELGSFLVPVVANPFLLNEAIESLRAYSLIARDPQTRTLTVHRLVQTVLRDTLPTEAQQQWMQRVVHTVALTTPPVEFPNWPTLEQLLPHARSCVTWIEQLSLSTPVAARLLDQVGSYLRDRGQYAQAEPLLLRAVRIYEQALGPLHPSTGNTLHELGRLANAQGKYAEAEGLYQRALHIYEQALGPLHPSTGNTLYQLGCLYQEQGKYEQAEPFFQQALRIKEQALGPEHSSAQITRRNYALLLRAMGRSAEASKLEEKS